MFALLIRCKLEDLVLQHRNASVSAENQINLIEVTDWTSLSPLAPQEVTRMFAFWDAVHTSSPIPFVATLLTRHDSSSALSRVLRQQVRDSMTIPR